MLGPSFATFLVTRYELEVETFAGGGNNLQQHRHRRLQACHRSLPWVFTGRGWEDNKTLGGESTVSEDSPEGDMMTLDACVNLTEDVEEMVSIDEDQV